MPLPNESSLSPAAVSKLWSRWAVTFVWLLTFATFVGLLWHLLWRGWAHSYDAAIYVRSLWGVAHGELFNPVVGLHTLSIHGNFVLYLLAPFARFAHPLTVLIVAQSAAIATTAAMLALEVRRSAVGPGVDRPSRVSAALFAGVAVVLGAPLISNPFLFDVRPDLIGVPLLSYGLIRAFRRGSFDVPGVLVMLSALLVREEYMMVVVGALVATPFPRRWSDQWKLRLAGVVAAVGYWAIYWFFFRRWIGDGSFDIANDVANDFFNGEGPIGAMLRYRAELLLVLALTAGGMAVFGWRWIGAALPGLVFLLVTKRMQALTLNFHYVQFVAPGLVVAVLAGFDRWFRREGLAGWWSSLMAALALTVAFSLSSALPGGGRYRYENFYVGPSRDVSAVVALREAHALLDTVPTDAGLAAPHELLAPLANRSYAVTIVSYLKALGETGPDPSVTWVALPGAQWRTAGRFLVGVHGFRYVGSVGGRLALLTRDNPDEAPAGVALPSDPPPSCLAPVGMWPTAGLALCDARSEDGRLRMTLMRSHSASAALAATPLTFVIVDPSTGARDTAWIQSGLVAPAQLPVGGVVEIVSEGPISPEGARQVALLPASGEPVRARFGASPALDATQRFVPVEF